MKYPHDARSARSTAPFVALTLLFATAFIPPSAPAADARQSVQVGPVQVTIEPFNRGMSIAVDGIPLVVGSNIVVTTPPWTPHYYLGPDAAALTTAERRDFDGGVELKLRHQGPSGTYSATETIRITADRVEQVVEGRFEQADREALVQWMMAGLNPVTIIGRPYRAKLLGGEQRAGVVSVAAQAGEAAAIALAKGFEWIEFDARIGTFKIEVQGNGQPICYDHRKNRWADPARPLFWLGDLGTRISADRPLKYRIVFHLPAAVAPPSTTSAPPVELKVTAHRTAQTWPQEETPILIPRPKEAQYGPGGYKLTVLRAIGVDPLARAAVPDWINTLSNRFGIGVDAQLGLEPNEQAALQFRRSAAENMPAEGYTLKVTAEGLTVAAGDEAGFRHAVQTLKQLTTITPEGDVLVRAAEIRDWPSLGFRGIHLFTGGQGADLHLKLIRNIMAGLKMNRLVLEAEYVEWDSHPEIHHPRYGMPKDEVRRILAACQQAGIEVIPLVMALGHCQWMFETGHNFDLAEDPEAKWAYCVTNPKTYDFIFEIYQEALELFKPKIFHIGHDEFHHRGRVPFRESSKPYTVEQLFTMDTLKLYEWLTARGVKVMMWSDMLLGPDEGPDACSAASQASAAKLRADMPKDILIADWHYVDVPPAKFNDLRVFHKDGFQTVAATWNRGGNITNFAKAASDNHALGHLQTTWAGYSLDPNSYAKNIRQYAAYVLAAEAAWNADRPPDPDTFPSDAYFLDLMGTSTLRPANRAGWTADLRPACNYALAAADDAGWFELGPQHDLSALPRGQVRLKGITFQIGQAEEAHAPAAIVLSGRLSRGLKMPDAVELQIGAPAAQLAIVQATNYPCDPGTRVGTYELTYEDGQKETLELVYGENVLAYTDLAAAPAAPIVWSGRTGAGGPASVRVLIWSVAAPDKQIRTLKAQSAHAAGALMILGITGLEAEGVRH
jgi:hexosaminidase